MKPSWRVGVGLADDGQRSAPVAFLSAEFADQAPRRRGVLVKLWCLPKLKWEGRHAPERSYSR